MFALLPAGAENAGQNPMGARTMDCKIASPSLAHQRHQADGPLGEVIGGMPAGAAKVPTQQGVQLDFQPPGGNCQAVCGQASCPMAIGCWKESSMA